MRPTRLGAFLLILFVGCGQPAPEPSIIQGTLLLDGEPLAGATVVWNPNNGASHSSGNVAADGKYTIANAAPGDGTFTLLPPQKDDIATQLKDKRDLLVSDIEKLKAEEAIKKAALAKKRPTKKIVTDVKSELPAQFARVEQSGFSFTVRHGINTKDFDVITKKKPLEKKKAS